MRFRVGKKRGDTLVEVTIAIGIFSMVAIAVVSVVNGSTSSSQSALETTVAREEIDAQAEALRFIQNSYLTDIGNGGNESELWDAITKKAVEPGDVLEYNVNQCSDIYNTDNYKIKNSFIINTRKLRDGTTNDIIKSYDKNLFYEASTYPRVVYSNNNSEDGTLLNQDKGTVFQRVEGLFIIAVKNSSSGGSATNIVEGDTIKRRSAYYDFYIRSCWYAPGSNSPTTISTVVRLYNPNVATSDNVKPIVTNYGDVINYVTGTSGTIERQRIPTGNSGTIKSGSQLTAPAHQEFSFWCEGTASYNPVTNGTSCPAGRRQFASGQAYTTPAGYTSDRQIYLYPVWKYKETATVRFYRNYNGSVLLASQSVYIKESTTLRQVNPTRENYAFNGWNTQPNGTGMAYAANGSVNPQTAGEVINLYAQWKAKPKDTVMFDCAGNGNYNATQDFYASGKLKTYATACGNAPSGKKLSSWWVVEGNTGQYTYGDGFNYTFVGGRTVKLKAILIDQCSFSSADYNYTGGMQSFTVPSGCAGTYQIEAYGAQGGSSLKNGSRVDNGGKGGYARASVTLTEGQVIYIAVGGKGGEGRLSGCAPGGWNGGGQGTNDGGGCGGSSDDEGAGGGGGATHIGKTNSLLKDTDRSNLFIVAGGGGGSSFGYSGGTGGGTSGGSGSNGGGGGATQSSGYAYGQGQNGSGGGNSNGVAGGGGGFYGGRINSHSGDLGNSGDDRNAAGGGSGYINSSLATNGVMYNGSRAGNGYVKITKK